MINKNTIDKLPTTLRNDINDHLLKCISRAELALQDGAKAFLVSTDEKQRASALIAQGELNAYTALYNLFK